MHIDDSICPTCRRPGGELDRLDTRNAAKWRLSLRCDWCHHRWSIRVSDQTLSGAMRARLAGQSTWPPPVDDGTPDR